MKDRRDVFVAVDTTSDYEVWVSSFLSGATGLVPVLIAGRPDLRLAVDRAQSLYEPSGRRHVASMRTVSRLPDALGLMVERLADPFGLQPLVQVGLYEDIKYATLDDKRHVTSERLITGRDFASLSWMVAKQFVSAREDLPVLVASDLDDLSAFPGASWLGPSDITAGPIDEQILGRDWGRALFHGNGHDDSLNLGLFTLCGRSQSDERGLRGYGPRCHLGGGCYKPEDKLMPVGAIRTCDLCLMNCFSGPSAEHATFSSDYQIMLAAIDGCARRIICTAIACDAGRPENSKWLAQPDHPLDAMAASLRDINPISVFVQVGLDDAID